MAKSSLSLSGLLAILVVSYCTALIHPEDVQVFSAVVTNRAYIFSRTCVLQCELDYTPSTSEEVNQLIQSMDLQQMLQAFMFDKEHMHKSTSFQRLFACLGEHVGLDKRMKSARATEWLWTQLLEGAGVFESATLRDIAIMLGRRIPKALTWKYKNAEKYDDPYNLLHRALAPKHTIIFRIPHILLFSFTIPADFVAMMESLRHSVIHDKHLPLPLRRAANDAITRITYHRVDVDLSNHTIALISAGIKNGTARVNELTALRDPAMRHKVLYADIYRISSALVYTTVSFVLSAVQAHIEEAARAGSRAIVTFADLLRGVDALGRTPLHAAVAYNNTHIINVIRNATSDSADVDARCSVYQPDCVGWTPLNLARRTGNTEAAAALQLWINSLAASNVSCSSVAHPNVDVSRFPVASSINVIAKHTVHAQIDAAGETSAARSAISTTSDNEWKHPAHIPSLSLAAVQTALQRDFSCDIAVVNAADIAPHTFLTEYWLPRKPVVLRGMSTHWNTRVWEKALFLSLHGNEEWPFGVLPHVKHNKDRKMSVRQFIEHLEYCTPASLNASCKHFTDIVSPYIFSIIPTLEKYEHHITRLPLLNIQVPTPSGIFTPLFYSEKVQLYVGGVGSGANLHYHLDAYNVLKHGEKQWYLLPPHAAEQRTMPVQQFVLQLQEDAGVLRCRQRAGDVLYVPKGWAHAVLNLETSVGYAIEFNSLLDRSYA